ncbi:MAG: hypothetical protein K0B81_01960 [Candidatus Cloacimonetes bacterium]|nr:hypothetical protein [Candidatus Cloacimonadota bacterium]
MIFSNISNNLKSFLLLCLFLVVVITTGYSFIEAQWRIINFKEHGTRRIVELDDNRWFFYRSEPNRELVLDIEGGRIMIKSAVRQDVPALTYQVKINNAFRNFTVIRRSESGDFVVMEDILLNLAPGRHTISISTTNRLAYFKVFREEEVWTVPTVRAAFEPQVFISEYTLKSEDSENLYYSASPTTPLEFIATGPNTITGFSRFLINQTQTEGQFDIEVNGIIIETVTIPNRRTGAYWLEQVPEQALSIGRRIEFSLPVGEHTVRIIPSSGHYFIYRLFMDTPEEIPLTSDPEYDMGSFLEPTIFQRSLTGLRATFGLTFGYNDNIFSLSDYDRDRFDDGEQILSFIETADDLIINPSLRLRYPINFGELTVEPYINANYYQYLSNSDKSNFSILTALFNSYQGFNLNLYYGYYGDLYARDYRYRDPETSEPIDYEKFEYEKNLYRLYSYFSLTRYDTPLLYYQIEEYFYNEFFTEYDGVATTYGLGWRRSFPTFYLRFFYYYRQFEPSNVSYNIDEVVISDHITDPAYESNIYDLQFRNKRINLINNYDFRPYFGFRVENRYYQTELPVEVAPFQSTREEKRYRINLGCDLYLVRNLNIILDYKHYLRDVHSENPNVAKYKDYRQNVFSIDFAYTVNF